MTKTTRKAIRQRKICMLLIIILIIVLSVLGGGYYLLSQKMLHRHKTAVRTVTAGIRRT